MKVDFLIIGQGLAGSALAVELLRRERRVMVVDRLEKRSSSRVAAGLVTPLTGRGMNPFPKQREYLDYALQYYHDLEKRSGRKLYHSTPVVRVFQTEKEREKWESKRHEHDEWAFDTVMPDKPLVSGHGAIEMPDGAWLDTRAYLQIVQDILVDEDGWMEADFSEGDVEFSENGSVWWKGIEAEKIILCQGAYGLSGVRGYSGWFGSIPHRSAKGEIISLWLDGLDEGKRYHGNGWIAPRAGGLWKVGASYDWHWLDEEPTEEGKQKVLEKLKTWVDTEHMPMEIIEHEAAIRPIIRNSRPLVGLHAERKEIGFFNGLGSKGTLVGPKVAAHFADYLCGNMDLDDELSLDVFLDILFDGR